MEDKDVCQKQMIVEANRSIAGNLQTALGKMEYAPLVSIIIVSHNGAPLLSQLFASFAHSNFYNNYEIIIVDNASSDDTDMVVAEYRHEFAIHVRHNSENQSFARACNQGASIARGDYLVFLNNDTEVTDGWLDALLYTAIAEENAGVVGARLIYPEMPERGLNAGKSYLLQHRGIRFYRDSKTGRLVPFNVGNGEDVSAVSADVKKIPAVTGACLLVKKDKFGAVGKFDENYNYGYEDVDFCLKLLRKGYMNYYCPAALLFHAEFGTQQHEKPEQAEARREMNRKYFHRRWGIYLAQEAIQEKLGKKSRFLTDEPLRIVFVASEKWPTDSNYDQMFWLGKEMREQYGATFKVLPYEKESPASWYEVGADTDLLISMVPNYDPAQIKSANPALRTIGWARSSIERWCAEPQYMCEYDHVLVSRQRDKASLLEFGECKAGIFDDTGASLAQLMLEEIHKNPDKIGILVAVPRKKMALSWGDYYFANGLRKAFEAQGYEAEIRYRDEWDKPFDGEYMLVLRGKEVYHPQMHHKNILWHISHPELVKPQEYDEYDMNYVASREWAEYMQDVCNMPVQELLQATSPELFHTGEKENTDNDELLYIGNTRGVERRILTDLLPADSYQLSVYGNGWDRYIPREYIKGEYLANEELSQAYRNSAILLNDHWPDMRDNGFISNRIFDALASGAFIISDDVMGIDDILPDCVVTYDGTQKDLHEKIDYYLSHPEEREKCAMKGAELVAQEHTFASRVKEFIKFMQEK